MDDAEAVSQPGRATRRTGTDGIAGTTLVGLQWTYGAFIATSVLQLAYTAVMGRLLTPTDFGVVALAVVALRFGDHFAKLGIGQALIQRPSITPVMVRAGFTSTTILGIAFAALAVPLAPVAAAFYDTPEVAPILRVLGLSFVATGCGVTATSLLARELRFRELSIVQTAAFAIGYVAVGIPAAALGAGAWSLVAATLVEKAAVTVGSYALVHHPLRPAFAASTLRSLYSFGGKVSVIGILEFVGQTLDTVTLGRYGSTASVGQYNRAQLLVRLPLSRLVQGMQSVMFPTMSRVQEDKGRLRGIYVRALTLLAAVIIPLGAGIAAAAPELVLVVLGSQWRDAVVLVGPMAVFVVAEFLALLPALVAEAAADLNRKLVVQTAYLLVLGPLLIVAHDSATTIAVVAAGAMVLRFGGYVLLMRRTLDLPARRHLRTLTGPMVAGALVYAGIAGIGVIGRGWSNALLVLGLQILAGAVVLGLSFRAGPLTGTRDDAIDWFDSAGKLDRLPARARQVIGILVGGSLAQRRTGR